MKPKTYTIVGATGNIGQKLVPLLLQRGHRVRAIGRDQVKLAALAALGAEPAQVDVEDAAGLARVFRGADAIFSLIPPNYGADDFTGYQQSASRAITEAIRLSKTKTVINLSSIGAGVDAPTGPVRGLYHHEQRLNRLPGLSVLHLRPAYFMENFYWSIPLIQNLGFNTSSLMSQTKIPMVATADIAQAAANALEREDIKGSEVFELGGPEDLNLDEATRILGQSIDRGDLKYVPVAYQAQEEAMRQSGMKPSISHLMVEMIQAMNEGVMAPTQTLVGAHRGKTSLREFAAGFAKAYTAK